jgi:hypothetical protein
MGQRQPLLYTTLNAVIDIETFTEVWGKEVADFTPIDTDASMSVVVPLKFPLSDLRARASDLKLELDPETDVTRLVQLFKGLWRMAIRRQCNKKKRQERRERQGVIAAKKPIAPKTLWLKTASRDWRRELPLRIIDAVIEGGLENLDTRLVNTLHQLPLKVVVSTLKMFKGDIIATLEEESMPAALKAFNFIQKAYF